MVGIGSGNGIPGGYACGLCGRLEGSSIGGKGGGGGVSVGVGVGGSGGGGGGGVCVNSPVTQSQISSKIDGGGGGGGGGGESGGEVLKFQG